MSFMSREEAEDRARALREYAAFNTSYGVYFVDDDEIGFEEIPENYNGEFNREFEEKEEETGDKDKDGSMDFTGYEDAEDRARALREYAALNTSYGVYFADDNEIGCEEIPENYNGEFNREFEEKEDKAEDEDKE